MFICVCGPSGSGKSTKAEELHKRYDLPIISSDVIREEICGDAADQSQNAKVFSTIYDRLKAAAGTRGAIFDATNLTPKDRRAVLAYASGVQGFKMCYYTDIPYEEAVARNAGRDRKVPEEVIEHQYAKYKIPTLDEGWTHVIKIKEN